MIHLRPEHQRDLRFLKETCGFEYMRFHGLLNEEMKVVKVGANGELIYDWTNIDAVYDFLGAGSEDSPGRRTGVHA